MMEGERSEGERGGENEGEICHNLVKMVKQKVFVARKL